MIVIKIHGANELERGSEISQAVDDWCTGEHPWVKDIKVQDCLRAERSLVAALNCQLPGRKMPLG